MTNLEMEKQHVGWRFWLSWVIMTNIGFFSGVGLGLFGGNLVEPQIGELLDKVIQNAVGGFIIGAFTGLAQGIVLARHQISLLAWIIATSLGWSIGIFIAGTLIFSIDNTIQSNDFFRWVIPAGFIAGAVVGIPQWLVLRQRLSVVSWWWILVSAFGWGIQFPGAISGLALTRLLRTKFIHSDDERE